MFRGKPFWLEDLYITRRNIDRDFNIKHYCRITISVLSLQGKVYCGLRIYLKLLPGITYCVLACIPFVLRGPYLFSRIESIQFSAPRGQARQSNQERQRIFLHREADLRQPTGEWWPNIKEKEINTDRISAARSITFITQGCHPAGSI
jgi:hypothetical protein